MTTIKTFPGVYTSIADKSFVTPATSLFTPGRGGVATKGPFDVPTPVLSLKDYVNKFGTPLASTYTKDSNGIVTPDGSGYFLADAVDALADQTDGIVVVRIGNQYTELAPSDAYSYGTNTHVLYSPNNAPRIQSLLAQDNGNLFIRVSQTGKDSTVNAQVTSANSGTISLNTSGALLQDTYTSATISYSPAANAANSAEGVLHAYTYGSNSNIAYDQAYPAVGSISGSKNDFQFYCSANASAITVGSVLKIVQANLPTTHEVRVKETMINYSDMSGTIFLEKTDISQIGYQASPLQATYTNATLYKAPARLRSSTSKLSRKARGPTARPAAKVCTSRFARVPTRAARSSKSTGIRPWSRRTTTFPTTRPIPPISGRFGCRKETATTFTRIRTPPPASPISRRRRTR